LNIGNQKLADVLNQISKERYGELRTLTKAHQVKERSLDSFFITLDAEMLKLQIQLL